MKITLLRLFSANVRLALLGLLMIVGSNQVHAEGSRDLYPANAKGNRAFLVSRSGQFSGTYDVYNNSWPFTTLGTHYVYVKAGETLHVASSAQGYGPDRIRLTSPNGTITSSGNSTTVGRIGSRAAELAGPRSTETSGDTYQAFKQDVTQEGIWKVEFIAPGGVNATNVDQVDILANGNWTQAASPSALIAAWDISVRKGNSWVSGRVYTNVLNLAINANFTERG